MIQSSDFRSEKVRSWTHDEESKSQCERYQRVLIGDGPWPILPPQDGQCL